MLRVVVLVSGGGTNLQAIIDAIAAGKVKNAQIVGVISNNKTVKSLERAQNLSLIHILHLVILQDMRCYRANSFTPVRNQRCV